jgi:hypothetical protein
MRVKCLSRSAKDLPIELHRHPECNLTSKTTFDVVVGKEYVVYAMTTHLESLWYYIRDEPFIGYPVWKPSGLFAVVDGRLPSCWRLGFHEPGHGSPPRPIIAFEEWVDDPLFYDSLTNLDAKAVAVFRRWQDAIDWESEKVPPGLANVNDEPTATWRLEVRLMELVEQYIRYEVPVDELPDLALKAIDASCDLPPLYELAGAQGQDPAHLRTLLGKTLDELPTSMESPYARRIQQEAKRFLADIH